MTKREKTLKSQRRRDAIANGELYFASERKSFRSVFLDLLILKHDLPLVLWRAWQDVKARYKRSVLGPYWLSIGTFTFIIGYTVLAGLLYKRPLEEFLGYIAAGVVTWQYIAANLVEGSKIFVSNAVEISASRVNLISLPFRLILKSLIGLAHSLPIVLLVIAFTDGFTLYSLMVIPGLFILTMTLLPLIIGLGTLAARFRDLEQAIAVVIQFFFYMTPIVWKVETLGEGRGQWLAILNPFYYELTIIRSPLLGLPVDWQIWCGAIAFMVISLIGGFLIYARFRQRIPFWV